MGWSSCGTDSTGRPIGYAHPATCDHPGCDITIDRGLSYACGGEHGETEYSCEGYFCRHHLHIVSINGRTYHICQECLSRAEEEGLVDDDWEDE